MAKVLYIACSSFSGSTLLSFLLNTHPAMTTVGHTVGYPFTPDEDFRCSCGQTLPDCPFFSRMAEVFGDNGLPFQYDEFGTRFGPSARGRVSRHMAENLPWVRSSALEKARDAMLWSVPGLGALFRRQLRANEVFVSQALAYSGAEVYVDNSHGPYRIRHLSRSSEISLSTVHAVRDFRGVVLSFMNRRGWTAAQAMRAWLREQADIVRVFAEFDRTMTVFYEDVCAETNDALAAVHRFVGLEPTPIPDDFKSIEHHILGNVMREGASTIRLDRRWRTDMSAEDRNMIEQSARTFIDRNPDHQLSRILERHFEEGAKG